MTKRRAHLRPRHRKGGPDNEPQSQVTRNCAYRRLESVAKECSKQGRRPNSDSKGLASNFVSAPYQGAAGSLQGEEEENPEPAAVAQGVIENVVWRSKVAAILEITHQIFQQEPVAGADEEIGVILLGINPDGAPPGFSPGDGAFVKTHICGTRDVLGNLGIDRGKTSRDNLAGGYIAAAYLRRRNVYI